MHAPLMFDDLTCESFNIDTNSTIIRDISKEDIRPIDSEIIDLLDSMLQDVELPYEEGMRFIDLDLDEDFFSRTYFDDLHLDDAYDTLFADIVPNPTLRWASPIPVKKGAQILNHDCMWAGHCGSSDPECDRALCRMMSGYVSSPPRLPVPALPQTSQQSLLKPNLRNAGIPVINMIAPQTPPMSDDDEKKDKLSDILSSRLLGESSSDMDEADRELREYFRRSTFDTHDEEVPNPDSSSESSESSESEEESPQQTDPSMPTSIRCNMYATVNDHSYHKDTSSMVMSDLGIDTPSDSGGSTPPRCNSVKSCVGESKKLSRRGRCNAVVANDMFDNAFAKNSFITDKREEEIDVVSISDKKYPVGTRMGYIPPSNPPNGGRRNIQRAAESTVIPVGRNNRNGLKIMLPTKRSLPASDNYPPAKRRSSVPTNENKGRKPRQTRTNQSNGRRRNDSEGSDFEQQPPMEKRNLHNDMERQRRVDLRKAFEELRQKVPEVARKERAAKVVILREAAKYCNNLTQVSTNLQKQRADLKAYQDSLQWKLKYLRRQVALENGVYDQENYDEYEED